MPSLFAVGLVVSVISSLGAPLIPTIARNLRVSLAAAQWSLTATLLVGAVMSPLIGRLGDGPHRKRVLLVCLSVVTLGGVLAACANTLLLLIAGRALQGLGLALMPLTMAAARDHLPAARASATIAMLSVTTAVGVGLGYPITGFIAEHFSAPAAFWFGAAASASALVLAALFVPGQSASVPQRSLDVRGAALIGAGILALLLGLEDGPVWGWSAAPTIGVLLLAALLLIFWTRNELLVEHPLVQLRLLRQRVVLTANVAGLLLGISIFLSISLMTQFVQLRGGINASVFDSGLTLLPLSVLSVASTRLVPYVRATVGPRATIPVGALVFAVAMLFFALTGDALWQAFVAMGVLGVGVGFTFAAMPGLIVSSVPRDETSSAMSVYQITRYIGFAIGSGLAVTMLRAFDHDSGALSTPAAYTSTFAVTAVICVVSAGVTWLLPGKSLSRGRVSQTPRGYG